MSPALWAIHDRGAEAGVAAVQRIPDGPVLRWVERSNGRSIPNALHDALQAAGLVEAAEREAFTAGFYDGAVETARDLLPSR